MDLTEAEKTFIDAYNKIDFEIWGSEAEEIKSFRAKIKRYLLQKQDYTCCYCLQRRHESHGATWDIDHVAPSLETLIFYLKSKILPYHVKNATSPNQKTKHLSIKEKTTLQMEPPLK